MISDPFKILGVSESATPEEIKRAYRQKAKTCHPDLHPDDPDAPRRMNELNEAYDLAMHPEKRQAQQQQAAYNPYQSYGGSGTQQGGYYYTGGFDPFADFFGYGYQQQSGQVQEEPGDSPVMREAVAALNMGRYQTAIEVLTVMAPSSRTARWYYLSALAHHGAGNHVMAMDCIKKATEMEPGNDKYRQLLQQYSRPVQTYQTYSRGFDPLTSGLGSLCSSACGICMFSNLLRCFCLPC